MERAKRLEDINFAPLYFASEKIEKLAGETAKLRSHKRAASQNIQGASEEGVA